MDENKMGWRVRAAASFRIARAVCVSCALSLSVAGVHRADA